MTDNVNQSQNNKVVRTMNGNKCKNHREDKLLVVLLCAGVSFSGIAETINISAGTTNETTLSEMAASPVAEYAFGDASAALVVKGTLAPSGGLASSVTFTNTVSGSGGRLVFDSSGMSDHGSVSNGLFATYSAKTVAENLSLTFVTNVTGILFYRANYSDSKHFYQAGFYPGYWNASAFPFQMRASDGAGTVYCAKSRIRQAGDDITVVVERVGKKSDVDLSYTFADDELSNQGIAGSVDGLNYGIYGCGVEWSTKGAAMTVTLDGTNATGTAGCVDLFGSPSVPLKASVTTRGGLPVGGTVNVYGGAELEVNLPSTKRVAATNLCVHPGGTLYLLGSYNVDANYGFHIDGGTLRFFSDGSVVEESYNRLYHLTLSNGARVTGGSPICCMWDRFYCTVTGSSPSYCDAILRLNADRDSRFAYFDVDDVTGDEAADFIVNRPMVQNNVDAVRTSILKRNSGTMLLAATNSYPHLTRIESGTLKLGVSDCLPATNEVWIARGATLSVADATTNALGHVSFTGAATLEIGAGSRLAIDSVSFDGGATATIAGPFGDRSLRIGTSACLSSAELAKFSCESGVNGRVKQDAAGWLYPAGRSGLMLIFR